MTAISTSVPETASAAVATRPPKLFHLQALRGLAASLVVLSHCANTLAERGLIPDEYAGRLGISGYFGVATFFMISGFIIYKTSRNSFGRPRATVDFIAKRLIRIFPVYWLATGLFLALSPHRGAFAASDIVYSLLLIPHVMSQADNMHPIVGQGWTLQYEILFYAIFTVGLLLPRRLGLLMIVAALFGLVAAGSQIMPLGEMSEPLTMAAYWSRPIMLLFIVGIGFGVLSENASMRISVPFPFLSMLGVLTLWFIYSQAVFLTASEQIRFPMVIAIWILAATWVFISIFGRSREGAAERIAEWFGDASYSVYLFHVFVLSALLRLNLQDVSLVLLTAAALVAANLFGFVMYRLVERPILRAARTWLLREG